MFGLAEQVQTVWLDLVTEFEDAVLVCDTSALEIAHWTISTSELVTKHRVTNVHHVADHPVEYQSAALFLLIGDVDTLSNMTNLIERWIDSHTQFVTVISLLSFASLKHVCNRDNPDYYYLDTLYQLNDTYLTVIFNFTCMSLPCFMFTDTCFITPNKLFPLLQHDLVAIETWLKSRGDNRSPVGQVLDITMLPKSLQLHIKVLAEDLGTMLDQLGVVEDCYSVGSFSRLVASQLAETAGQRTGRRKQAANKLDVIFVDRTLDLFNLTSFDNSTSAATLLFNNSPELFEESNDIRIDLKRLFNKPAGEYVISGCLVDSKSSVPISTLLSTDHVTLTNDILGSLEGQLQLEPDTLETRDLAVILPETDTYSKYQHFPHFQILAAVLQCLEKSEQVPASLSNLDTSLLWTTLEDSVLISQLVNSILSSCEAEVASPSLLLTLLTHLLSLFGDKAISGSDIDDIEQAKLKNTLFQLLQGADEKFSETLTASCKTDEEVHCQIDRAFRKIECLGGVRAPLNQLKTLVSAEGGSAPVYKPIIQQILDLCFEGTDELVDIEYRSGGLRDLLKTGLGLFTRAVSKPRPSGHVLVYVVGGVSVEEVRVVEQYRARTGRTVYLAGNCVLNQAKLNNRLLCSDNVFGF